MNNLDVVIGKYIMNRFASALNGKDMSSLSPEDQKIISDAPNSPTNIIDKIRFFLEWSDITNYGYMRAEYENTKGTIDVYENIKYVTYSELIYTHNNGIFKAVTELDNNGNMVSHRDSTGAYFIYNTDKFMKECYRDAMMNQGFPKRREKGNIDHLQLIKSSVLEYNERCVPYIITYNIKMAHDTVSNNSDIDYIMSEYVTSTFNEMACSTTPDSEGGVKPLGYRSTRTILENSNRIKYHKEVHNTLKTTYNRRDGIIDTYSYHKDTKTLDYSHGNIFKSSVTYDDIGNIIIYNNSVGVSIVLNYDKHDKSMQPFEVDGTITNHIEKKEVDWKRIDANLHNLEGISHLAHTPEREVIDILDHDLNIRVVKHLIEAMANPTYKDIANIHGNIYSHKSEEKDKYNTIHVFLKGEKSYALYRIYEYPGHIDIHYKYYDATGIGFSSGTTYTITNEFTNDKHTFYGVFSYTNSLYEKMKYRPINLGSNILKNIEGLRTIWSSPLIDSSDPEYFHSDNIIKYNISKIEEMKKDLTPSTPISIIYNEYLKEYEDMQPCPDIKINKYIRTETLFLYDKHNQIERCIYDNGKDVYYIYNDDHKLIRCTDLEGVMYSFEYNERGNVIRAVTNKGTKVYFIYNNSHQMIRTVKITCNTYPGDEMTEMGTSVVHETEYEYNENGYVSKEIYSNGDQVIYKYTQDGNRLSECIRYNGDRINMKYDNKGNLIKIQEDFASKDQSTSRVVIELEYDQNNNIIKEMISPEGSEWYNKYDNNNNQIYTKYPGGVIEEFNTYDSNNNINGSMQYIIDEESENIIDVSPPSLKFINLQSLLQGKLNLCNILEIMK